MAEQHGTPPDIPSQSGLGLAAGFGLQGISQGLFEGGQAGRGVYDALRNRIVRLELVPGTPLPRAELARQFGVSITPLRDALQQLAEEGLVLIFPQSRTLVAPIDVTAIREAQFLRMALETEVVRELSTAIAPEDLERLRGIHKLQSSLVGDADSIATFQELDEVFHMALFAAAGHMQTARLMRSRSGHLDRLRRIFLPDAPAAADSHANMSAVIDGHGAVIDAITAGRPEDAAEAMRRHLRRTVDRLSEKRAAFPEYFG